MIKEVWNILIAHVNLAIVMAELEISGIAHQVLCVLVSLAESNVEWHSKCSSATQNTWAKCEFSWWYTESKYKHARFEHWKSEQWKYPADDWTYWSSQCYHHTQRLNQ